MKKTLQRIALWQAGKIGAALFGMASIIVGPLAIGPIVVCLVALGIDFFDILLMFIRDFYIIAHLWGGIGLVVLPIVALGMIMLAGFLTGIIGAWLYNLAAKKIGGIQIEFGD